jgi:hypothetical protein
MLFGAAQHQLDLVKETLPEITELTLNVSRTEYDDHHTYSSESYTAWAANSIMRAMESGFDVLALVTGSNRDLTDDLRNNVDFICDLLKSTEIPDTAGKLIGLCFDLEWENDNFSHNGWRGYTTYVGPVLHMMEVLYPSVRRFGPGGTHSDDKTLPDLLDKLREDGVSFTHITFHAYSDKGWKKYTKRIKKLIKFFKSQGYDTVHITECGVTGQDCWGDRRRGQPNALHYTRLEEVKEYLDSFLEIHLKQIYQITEPPAPEGEEHGWGFGMFASDMTPKLSVRHFNPTWEIGDEPGNSRESGERDA